ncbi:MAG: UDP-glucose 4-epimerase [Parcubacteria group bacterium Greene0416_79]|nr:MAG: UDP-glucose 4-epimerase [Parcubacteria group bacterium Greene0416_79]
MALSGEDIVLNEDGNQIRDFVNVHDVVSAHLVALKDSRANFEAFNVGSGRQTRVRDLAEVIAKEAGVSVSIKTPGLYRIGAPRHSPSDISKLKALGWAPEHSVADGVREYIEWIKQYPESKKFLHATLRSMHTSGILR